MGQVLVLELSLPVILFCIFIYIAGDRTLVPKLTLGPSLTPSVRNGHKLKDWILRIPAHIESKSG